MMHRLIVPLATLFGLLATSGSACSVHDQFCQFHGVGRAVSNTINQDSPTAVFIVSEGSNGIDYDNNILLPDGNGPYIASGVGFVLDTNQPYLAPGEQPRHVYPGQYQIDFQNGTAQASHSGDFNGAVIIPGATGCEVSGVNCEEIKIVGNIPDLGTPEGFVVKQTNYLYNFFEVPDPEITINSYAVATGNAYFKNQNHFAYAIIGDDPSHSAQVTTTYTETLVGDKATGTEQTYYIGYDNFNPHAAGTVVHNAQRRHIGSQEYSVQFGHETVAGDIDPYTGLRRNDTYSVYDVTYDHETYVDATTGLPALVRSEQETDRYTVTSGIYEVQTNQAYVNYQEAERQRQESWPIEIQIASARATADFCSQANGVCASGWSITDNNTQGIDVFQNPNTIISFNGHIPDAKSADIYWINDPDTGKSYPFLESGASVPARLRYGILVAGVTVDYVTDNPVVLVDGLQQGLDNASWVGVTGVGEVIATPLDLVNAGISGFRGVLSEGDARQAHFINGGLSLAGVVSFGGGGTYKAASNIIDDTASSVDNIANSNIIQNVTAPNRTVTDFVDGVTVVDRRTGTTFTGPVDLRPTLDRIDNGISHPHQNDGSTFRNREGLLPSQSGGYYTEFVHPTPGVNGPGPQRIIRGQGGELYYTPDHYGSFIQLNQ